MTASTLAVVLHTLVVLALLGAYVAVTVTGMDGNALLGLLAGYIGGAGVQAGAEKAGASGD